MRKHLRAIAKANMEREGIQHFNRPRADMLGNRAPSIFASNWQKYLKTPTDIERKAAKIRAKNEERRIARNEART